MNTNNKIFIFNILENHSYLPIGLSGHAMMKNDAGNLFIVGGETEKFTKFESILKMTCRNRTCEWTILDQQKFKLKMPRAFHVAMMVPEDICKYNNF